MRQRQQILLYRSVFEAHDVTVYHPPSNKYRNNNAVNNMQNSPSTLFERLPKFCQLAFKGLLMQPWPTAGTPRTQPSQSQRGLGTEICIDKQVFFFLKELRSISGLMPPWHTWFGCLDTHPEDESRKQDTGLLSWRQFTFHSMLTQLQDFFQKALTQKDNTGMHAYE